MLSGFPYDSRPDYALWKRAVQHKRPVDIDPLAPVRFTISNTTRVATAGSCFARHIASNLQRHGFNYFCTEAGTEYSARFGNVYTTLQLLQLFDRAYGNLTPVDDAWTMGDRWVDPLRPRVVAGGFETIDDMRADRFRHLEAVRAMFEGLDVFIFTLGLTEGFVSRIDGTAFPACPGKDFGEFDPTRFDYCNLNVSENIEYLTGFIERLASVNPRAKVLLTVSPVPLVATMEDRSVIQSTVYSKSVLRVAADEIRRMYESVDYFWSYEIITASFNSEHYFEPDRRSVNEAGVSHVMRSFFSHFAEGATTWEQPVSQAFDPCDEEILHKFITSAFDQTS